MNISNMINKKIDEKISNKKQETVKYYIRIALTLLIISSVTAAMLAFVNGMTKERIAENEFAVMKDAIGNIFVGCDDIKALEGEYPEPVTAVYEVYGDGTLLGYGIQSAPVGFKDVIGLIIGTDKDGKCLGVEVTSISDTPGVGTKVKEGNFLYGFKSLNAENVDDYDTISGATISSKAVKEGVSAALKLSIFGDAPVIEETQAETENDSSQIPVESVAEETDSDVSVEETLEENLTEGSETLEEETLAETVA